MQRIRYAVSSSVLALLLACAPEPITGKLKVAGLDEDPELILSCGDGHCDPGEGCDNCVSDCGECTEPPINQSTPDAGASAEPDSGTVSDPGTPDAGTPPVDSGTSSSPDSGTPPPQPTSGFSFFATGDTRSNPDIAESVFASMSTLDPNAIGLFNSGDVTADGRASQWDDHIMAVENGAQGLIRLDLEDWDPNHIRYFAAIGNHDVHESSWLTEWNNYLPGPRNLGNNGSNGVWYSATYGNALFIVLDSQHFDTAQTNWLETTLAASTDYTWKFAMWHKPVYPCNYKSPWDDGVEWVRLLEQYGVDMVFLGHAHVYERTCPMVGGTCQTGGVRFITVGGGGAGTNDVTPDYTDNAGGDEYNCAEIQDKGIGNWHHYCRLNIDGAQLNYDCYSHDSVTAPRDSLTITKSAP